MTGPEKLPPREHLLCGGVFWGRPRRGGSVYKEETQLLLPWTNSQEAKGEDSWAEAGGSTWH